MKPVLIKLCNHVWQAYQVIIVLVL